MSVTTTYAVTGMTCEHCVAAVADEITKIEGVDGVSVDLGTGRVTAPPRSSRARYARPSTRPATS
jgi:copper chaperone